MIKQIHILLKLIDAISGEQAAIDHFMAIR